MALNKWETGIVEKENNGTNLHSFESIPIWTWKGIAI